MGSGMKIIPPVFDNRGVRIEQSVIDNQRQLAARSARLTKPRFPVFHNQRTGQPARDLFRAAIVGMIPVCTGIGGHEIIVKALAWWNRCLRQGAAPSIAFSMRIPCQ